MLWLLTSPKNSNRSFSFLSEKKSNFVKALDHLEASQQQSINISIEEGDAACGAQLGCGPARGHAQPSPWITFDKMLSLSRFMFYEFTLWLLASSFADTGWNLTNTLQHWGNLPLLSPLYITTYSKLFCLVHCIPPCCLLSLGQCISVAGGSNQYLRGLVVSPLNLHLISAPWYLHLVGHIWNWNSICCFVWSWRIVHSALSWRGVWDEMIPP